MIPKYVNELEKINMKGTNDKKIYKSWNKDQQKDGCMPLS